MCFFNFLLSANGIAQPAAKRKKGKTKSTQVIPGKFGLNLFVGGGN